MYVFLTEGRSNQITQCIILPESTLHIDRCLVFPLGTSKFNRARCISQLTPYKAYTQSSFLRLSDIVDVVEMYRVFNRASVHRLCRREPVPTQTDAVLAFAAFADAR